MIEGFLFPATYSFQPDETAKDMLTDDGQQVQQVIDASLDFKNGDADEARRHPADTRR